MRFLWFKATNYIGIYNGLGLNEIEIDFTKCKNRIIIIRGENGSGKSTLENMISLLPDNNFCYLPGLPAGKEGTIIDGDIIYNMKIISGIKRNGDRETTKAYLSKIVNGEETQLNPNGNVTSYKEILFDEFGLDPNFLSLSYIGSENRGLVDMTPSDRKKFVSAIINTVEVFNNIYKKLSKKSASYRTLLNNIVSKLNSIGDESSIRMYLVDIENRLKVLKENKDKLIQDKAEATSKVKILDPDGSIQNKYNDIYKDIIDINAKLKDKLSYLNTSLVNLGCDKDTTVDTITVLYNKIKECISISESRYMIEENKINELLLSREEEAKSIQSKSARLVALQSDNIASNLDDMITDTRNKVSMCKSIIDEIGIQDIDNISKDEFVLGLNTLKEVKEAISVFKSNYDSQIILDALYKDTPDIDGMKIELERLNNQLIKANSQLQEYETLKKIASKLELRDSKCAIDTCGFIKDALEAAKSEPDKNISSLVEEISYLEDEIANKNLEYNEACDLLSCKSSMNSFLRNINNSMNILRKLPVSDIALDNDKLIHAIVNNYDFKEIDRLYGYIELADTIDEYKRYKNILNNLEADYKIYKAKNDIIDEILKDIDELNKKLDNINQSLEDKRNEVNKLKDEVVRHKSNLVECEVVINLFRDINDLRKSKQELGSSFDKIKSDMIVIKDSLDVLDKIDNDIDYINKQIEPLEKDREMYNHNLHLLYEYTQELEEYKSKSTKVDIIRKYASPTKGIQTLYIDLYMDKILGIANNLLSYFFRGEYTLGKFIINENEFRIPCLNNGIMNDDISSMSTSQKCMISMIISFALLQYSSGRYNIIKLDEIDGGLDTANRAQFMSVINTYIGIMNIEQLFIVSHNIEMDYSMCDVIQLRKVDNEPIDGNVIYEYL